MQVTKEKEDYRGTLIYDGLVGAMAIFAVLLGLGLVFLLRQDLSSFPSAQLIDTGIEIFGMSVCSVLLYSCVVSRKLDKKSTILGYLLVIIGISLFLNLIDGFVEGNVSLSILLKIIYTLEYVNDDLIVCVFWYFVYIELAERKQRYKKIAISVNVVVLISIIFTLANWFGQFFFHVDENGRIVQEGFYALLSVLPAVYVYFVILGCVINLRATWREKAVLLSFEILPAIATFLLISKIQCSLVYPAYLLSVVLIYIEFYERRRKKIAEQEAELTKQSMSLLISQIQPHFIYNTLTAISNLCVKDPYEAEETTVLFSQYLRGNLDSLSLSEPIPFAKEMEHVRIYTELEKKRFKDKLNIVFDLAATDFAVPALSIQPIVENSIKHGVCQKSEGGSVRISSEKTADGYLVVIEDDGVGFDTSAELPSDGKSHVGLSNVRNRLMNMCDATMTVESSPGCGCRTKILFPIKARK